MISVLVTGGCGFIGSNFINYALEHWPEWNIVNIDCMNYAANADNVVDSANPRYRLIRGNVRNYELVSHILTEFDIKIVIHFAAMSHVDMSFLEPVRYVEENVVGTATLIEACKSYGRLDKFIHISTDEVFGPSHHDEDHKTEESIMCPTNPYSASKGGAELMVRSYYYSYGFPAIVIRSNNIYGPRQLNEKVIPRFIIQLMQGNKVTLHGDGSTLRSFLHVDDFSRALTTVLEHGEIGDIINIGSDREVSIHALATMLIRQLQPMAESVEEWMEFIVNRPYNDQRYLVNCTKLRELGWRQEIEFEEGLRQTIEWYRNHMDQFVSTSRR